ncbi:MAG: cysteine desulfurase family protein [Sumerlaeia bacterium]
MKAIFLDNNSTTQLDPAVLESMLPWFSTPANASSEHAFGHKAKEAVECAREQVADLVGAAAREVVFTSGATEANNLALLGFFGALRERGGCLLTSEGEHRAVLDPATELERLGTTVVRLPLRATGIPEFADYCKALNGSQNAFPPKSQLVSLMHANNETGVVLPLQKFAEKAAEAGVLFHTDATQSAGKLPLDMKLTPVDLLSLSAHKLHGPMGIGALIVKQRSPRIRLKSLQFGGGQEFSLRSGTLNVPAIVGFGKAAELAKANLGREAQTLSALRNQLQQQLISGIADAELNGSPELRLPNTLNLFIPTVQASALVAHVEGVGFSSGSACSASTPEPSHVLRSMFQQIGEDEAEDRARCSIRLAVSRFTTQEEINNAAALIISGVKHLRQML